MKRGFAIGAALAFCFALSSVFAEVPKAIVEKDIIRVPVYAGKLMRFTRLSTTDGLSQTRVSQIVQDDKGFIWFGTQYGLNRYDGYEYKVFVHDPRRPNSLSGAFVTALFKDQYGAIWVACPQTLDRFDPVTETFNEFSLCVGGGEEPATVVHISEDKGGLWLSTGAGLYRLDPSTGEVTRYQHSPSDPSSLSSNDIKSSGEDRDGNFWVGTSEGLDRFDRSIGKVTLHVPIKSPVQINFFEDREGKFWIYSATGDGLASLDRATNRLTFYSFRENSPESNELTGIMGMIEDSRGELWIGSPGAGLFRLDRKRQSFEQFKNDPTDLHSIAEDKVITLFKDREGNVWAGLHSSAPNYFSPRPRFFEVFAPDPGNPNSLEMNFVNAMFEDSRGYLWIGNDLGVTRIDRRTGEYRKFNEGLGGKPMVVTVAEDSGGGIWVGTYGHGIARLDQATGKFTRYFHRNGDETSLANDQVHRLFVDSGGTLWAGTDDGLSRFDEASESFKTYKVIPGNRWAQSYVAFAEDAKGILWMGTHYSGLHRFDPKAEKFLVYKAESDVPGTLGDNMVPTVHVDKQGLIWVGTQSGLNRFDPKTGRFTVFYQSKGRPGDTVSCILEDQSGNLWISSNRGIYKFNPSAETFQNFSANDGLPGNDLTGWGTGSQNATGEMFFGGFAGGVAFRPESFVDDDYVPPIALTALHLPFATTSLSRSATDGRAISYAAGMTLPYQTNSFSLEFSALSYFNPPANRYRYKLDGLDDRWNEVDSEHRTATYTTLPPGKYTFRVQGATSRGGWSDPGVSLPVHILPAWWQTWWFRGGIAVLAALAVLWGFRLRVRHIRDREREFRKLAENAPDMVMRFDAENRFSYANPRTEKFAGARKGGLVKRRLRDVEGNGVELPVKAASLVAVLKEGKPRTEEYTITRIDGQLHFETRLIPEAGALQTVLVIIRDITVRKRTEEALRKSQTALAHVARVTTIGEMTASIAHEVNQPLTGIVTNGNACMRWLSAAPPNLPEADLSLKRIVRDGKRAAEIIARIRALVRRTETQLVEMDLNDAIAEVLQIIESEIRKNNVELELKLETDLPAIKGDRVQLQQVMINLIMNAIDAMSGENRLRKKLRVSSECDAEQVLVKVCDSGHGLDPDKLEGVFEAFFTTKAQGMGMGLAISRSIIEMHGGRLWAKANEQRGTTFNFTIPRIPVS